VLDHTASALGGAQLVVSRIAGVLAEGCEVELIHNGAADYLARLSSAFSSNLGKIRERRIPALPSSFSITGVASLLRRQSAEISDLSRPYDLFIYSGHGIPPRCFGRRGIVYCHFPFEAAPLVSVRTTAAWARQGAVNRWMKKAAYEWEWKTRLGRYDKIFANSRFTAEWIERRWQTVSEILYPPVEVTLPTAAKKNIVLSIGRMTGGPRSKNQLAQIEVFHEFIRRTQEPWTLRIIGSCGESAIDRDYLESLRKRAEGLRVELLVNVDRATTVNSLAEARLFWHTAGLDVDESERPEFAEHFGIAAVEAMRAGCVPVVIASGGLREIIEHEKSGFLVSDLKAMADASAQLACSGEKLALMGEAARRRSLVFDHDGFDRRFRTAVSECLAA
jgi:glycosyltransferase involved in cell wall biosynthesis